MKAAAVTLCVGALAAAGWLLVALGGGDAMPSYLAGWLLVFGIPAGALLLVMAQEALGYVGWSALPVLRRAALLLPVVGLFAIPMLLQPRSYQPRPLQGAPIPSWAVPGAPQTRMVVILVVLSLLAVVFSRTPARPRQGAAVLGCILQVCLLSVAAVDWVMALQPGLNSAVIGLLVISSQLGTACCLLAFVSAVRSPYRFGDAGLALLLTAVLAVWGFLHFVQYLVIWSADLPREIVWYQARLSGLGTAAVAFAAVATFLALAILPSALARLPAVLASLAAMMLLAHWVETLWLVTPAFRGQFRVTAPDLLATIGFGGLVVGLMLVLLPRPELRGA